MIPIRVCAALAASLLIGCSGGSSGGSASTTAATTSTTRTAEPTALRGQVTFEGAPAQGVFLIVTLAGTETVPEVRPASLFPDAEGRFAIELPPGRYDVTAVCEQGTARAEATVAPAGAASEPLALTLQPVDHDARLRELVDHGPARPSEEAR